MAVKKKPDMVRLKKFLSLPQFPARCGKVAKDAMGVELEHEFPKAIMLDHIRANLNANLGKDAWFVEPDGSLRGNGLEFISKPLTLAPLLEHIDALYKAFDAYGAKPAQSHRTSTHVHINFSKNTLKEVYQFLLLYYFLEPTLFCLTEEDRWHNTFCVSSETVPYQISELGNNFYPFWEEFQQKERYKYSSLNLVPFTELGTLESRIYHGAYDVGELKKWVTVLAEIKQFAVSFPSMKALYKFLEETEFKDVLKKVFVTTHKFVVEHIAMREKKLYDLANIGNSMAYPLLGLEKRLKEAEDFFTEEQERVRQLVLKLQQNEKEVENYDGIFELFDEAPV